jgi:hypothetical protein
MGALAQRFVQAFLVGRALLTLDKAGKIFAPTGELEPYLSGESLGSVDAAYALTTIYRTRVRRLYDIANVLSALGLVKKAPIPQCRKPAFQWLGTSSVQLRPGVDRAIALDNLETRRRARSADSEDEDEPAPRRSRRHN